MKNMTCFNITCRVVIAISLILVSMSMTFTSYTVVTALPPKGGSFSDYARPNGPR